MRFQFGLSGNTERVAEPGVEAFEKLVALLNYPMFVVTTQSGGVAAGCLVGFASQATAGVKRARRRSTSTRISRRSTSITIQLLSENEQFRVPCSGFQVRVRGSGSGFRVRGSRFRAIDAKAIAAHRNSEPVERRTVNPNIEQERGTRNPERATAGSCVAFIPARSGSKRVTGKNVRMLGGHPMLAYTIAAARESGVFESVIVSTETEDIASIARQYGADVPFLRPAEFAGDTSPDIEWLEHMIAELGRRGRAWDCFSLLRPTSPFRTADTIRRAWALFTAQAWAG